MVRRQQNAPMAKAGTDKTPAKSTGWESLNQRIISCKKCPRLVQYCDNVAKTKRRAYLDTTYWGRPVPNFGDPSGKLLIVGLAPGAHGANRTGRMFTGDRSGQWLFRALHRAGFASQPTYEQADDGMQMVNCTITAVCHCAPPQNKPTRTEVRHCETFLCDTINLLRPAVYVCLGQLAWNEVVQFAMRANWLVGKKPKFGHGQIVELADSRWLVGSYHPSQQNTFTGRLTEKMLDGVFESAKRLLGQNEIQKTTREPK